MKRQREVIGAQNSPLWFCASMSGVARSSFKTVGDCPNFAESSEQNGTVPFSETVMKLLTVFFGLGA